MVGPKRIQSPDFFWSSASSVFTSDASFLGCLVSFVLKILYLFLYAIFKVHQDASYKRCIFFISAAPFPGFLYKESGSHLLSHAVSSIVPSAAWGLTIVFGMGTGVSPRRIATGNLLSFLTSHPLIPQVRYASSRYSGHSPHTVSHLSASRKACFPSCVHMTPCADAHYEPS